MNGMFLWLIVQVWIVSQYLLGGSNAYEAFSQEDERGYLDAFDTLIKDSYSSPLPQGLLNSCRNGGQLEVSTIRSINTSMSSSELQEFCGVGSLCVIPVGVTVTMTSDLNVGALLVRGRLIWNDRSQLSPQQWLCAGYIAVDGGRFEMSLSVKEGYVYMKNNGMEDGMIHTRAFGAYHAGRIDVRARPLTRTWSLLAQRVSYGMSSITLLHQPQQMGWRVGDRIVIAPTTRGSSGNAERFRIGGFSNGNGIELLHEREDTIGMISSSIQSERKYTGEGMSALLEAEVINLSRNILITGDDFEHVQCRNDVENGQPSDAMQSDHCSCWKGINRNHCTVGLHTIAIGENARLSLQYTRIEKCGQRGILGKYCIHLHLIGQCPECQIIGNAIEYGHQRGTTIHGTHLATVEKNVYNDIRGATIYIEDGNEMHNRIFYNVGICPWAKSGEKRGCTIPGTDNGQADTTLNQAGLWALSFTNDVIGNRFANNYNGMLYQEQGLGNGRGQLSGLECLGLQQMGRLEGNTFHGCGRFGTYVLASIFPKHTDRTMERNGLPRLEKCEEWTENGEDNGYPATFMNNIDYHNVFVGQYNAGDLQYRYHTSIENQNLIYWKETKNFQDGCSAHLADSFYEEGNLALPGGHGAFILENMTFANQVHFESSHHCQSGVTGVLCMATYVFVKMQWIGQVSDHRRIVQWGPNHGAMFTLSPEDPTNPTGNSLFPRGFTSIVHPYWSYLFALDNGQSCFPSDEVADLLGEDRKKFAEKYDGGAIFCKRGVRRLEIFSFNQNLSHNQAMELELWQEGRLISSVRLNYFEVSERKQGYSATVIPGLDHQYRLAMSGGGNVPEEWIIEFSDPVFGNRWKRDEIDLIVQGRNCPSPVHSQHDRRYIWSGENFLRVKGRGACTSHPSMPLINCQSQPKLTNIESCPEKCPNGCSNGDCDCARGECLCQPGFAGANCQRDLCAAARCVNGNCAARYLGSDLPVSKKACVCMEGWYGERCDTTTPPPALPPSPPRCFNGSYFLLDTDIVGGNLRVVQTSDAIICNSACHANADCQSWVLAGGVCFLKTGTRTIHQSGTTSGIKCSLAVESSSTRPLTVPPPTEPAKRSSCDGKCQGQYPHGCNDGFPEGYCNAGGGCRYTALNSDWCCFKGCEQ